MWPRDATTPLALYADPCTRPVQIAQTRVLWNLVRRFESSPFGVVHGFADVESIRDYQERVPVQRCKLDPPALKARELFPIAHSATAGTKLGSLADIVSPSGGWLDLEYCVRQLMQTTSTLGDESYNTAMDQIVELFGQRSVEVLVGPMDWLPDVFTRLHDTRRSPGLGAGNWPALAWPDLRVVIGTSSGYAPTADIVRDSLARRDPAMSLISAYQTPDGIIAGIETAPGTGIYRLLPSAGVFFEFVDSPSTEACIRLPLHETRCGNAYEMCVSTKRGIFAHLTGLRVTFVPQAPPTEPRPVANRMASGRLHDHAARNLGAHLPFTSWDQDAVYWC